MEHILKKSRVCLAGRFNAKKDLKHEDLNSSDWKRIEMSEEEYDMTKRHYYPSLLRSMIEIKGEKEQSVYRYEMVFCEQCDNLMVLKKKNDGTPIFYPCRINKVQLWFFPFDMVLFSIEIEETTKSFSDLTLMHSKWKAWSSEYEEFRTEKLDNLFKPLTQLILNEKFSQINYLETKMRQYQVIETEIKKDEFETDTIKDDLLYEIGTFSPIGVVADADYTKSFKPSTDYFNQIIRDNTLSVYSNWKALALNDSFTVLAIDGMYSNSEYNEYDGNQLKDTGYYYFDLLYMRCLLEEFYCFDRNNLYHEVNDTDIDSGKIEREIAYMEKHYFFEEMSYDFLPPLMYRAMAKGLELQKDREQLTQHVKQALRDARREHMNNAINFVKIFAVFSAIWTIRAMVIAICPCIEERRSAFVSAFIALSITILLFRKPHIFTKLFHSNKN